MSLESIMNIALGALASALVMLMVMPAIWRRAVRLTKKRIEAATPVSLAEFRADKDQLRAEFALSTRRLEMQVEQLRKRLAEQLGGVDQRRRDLAALKTERADHETQVGELETREAELREQIAALEKESAGLNERLAAADRTLVQKATQLADAREALRAKLPPTQYDNGRALSGNYDEDIDELVTALAVEKKRASFLEGQTRDLMAHLEAVDRKSIDADAALAELKRNLLPKDDKKADK